MTLDLSLSTRAKLPCPRCAAAIQHGIDCPDAAKERIDRMQSHCDILHAQIADQAAEIERLRTRAEVAEELAAQYAARADAATKAALRAGWNVCDGCGHWHNRLGAQMCRAEAPT